MIQVPVTRNGNSDYDVTLDGVTYTIQYRYNTRNQRVFMNILKDGVMLIAGMRLLEYNLANYFYANEEAPKGTLYVAPLKTVKEKATLGNLGISNDYSLIYFTQEELEK